LDLAADQYELWMFEARVKRIDNEPEYAAGAAEACKPYLQALLTVMKDLKEHARRQLQ
jgi:hypothetical protein